VFADALGSRRPPILNVKANDTVRIHALNNLDMACSIHHHVRPSLVSSGGLLSSVHGGGSRALLVHLLTLCCRRQGIFFNQTNYYDGAPGITQCPIPPGAKLTCVPVLFSFFFGGERP